MIHAIVIDPLAPSHLAFKEVDSPQAQPWEALVQVKAISLNRGEVKDAQEQEVSSRPGWDFAGIVIEPAKSGAGPLKGARVVGLLPMGAWSEQVAAPVSMLAQIPDKLTFSEAATLPVAGLTALYALRKGGMLLGKRIFITGSTGGVGLFAHQLAAQSGAYVVGTASTEEKAELVRKAGADEVVIGYSAISSARQFGPYDLIIDSVGGDTLAALLPQLAPQGICVAVGFSSSNTATIDMMNLVTSGGRTLYSFFLGEELTRQSAADDLSLLARLVADGRLKPRIEVETPWTEIDTVSRNLLERKFSGKAVLHLGHHN
ncbi:zinc-binding dehydrogenase [Paenibacillus sp. HN-1]|uniref:zinc-binding dehydrogenase n=1 Tax=Paenibacillus TaxID=44249 RepID=UPI001CA972A5|nr:MULTISPECIES: zinc-binding dehydrogenase [Paenibacillus]MBY9078741.1 zinc-binding dehydrogenase [Paenibacillus sp. CGMCC 1.18879]MBY9088099.1 zinc-binding dehydrogenase [Paenibacillus sinensis]